MLPKLPLNEKKKKADGDANPAKVGHLVNKTWLHKDYVSARYNNHLFCIFSIPVQFPCKGTIFPGR